MANRANRGRSRFAGGGTGWTAGPQAHCLGGYWWILVDTTVSGRIRLAMVTTNTTVSGRMRLAMVTTNTTVSGRMRLAMVTTNTTVRGECVKQW